MSTNNYREFGRSNSISKYRIKEENRDIRIALKNELMNTIKQNRQNRSIRDGDDDILAQIFPPPLPEPEPVLTKFLKRDYVIFDRVDDFGNEYRYGVFAVYSSFIKFDQNGDYLDPTIASNVDNITRVITSKTLIVPSIFGSNSIGEPTYVEAEPVLEFGETSEDPTPFVDRIFTYETNGGARSFEIKKTSKKIVERDELQDVVDPVGTPFSIESAISAMQDRYDRHILDLFYHVVNMNYVSATEYNILMQTVIVMLGI